MKTAKELTTEIIKIAKWTGVFNGELEIHTEKLLSEFESEIRKDQDKITRHSCAESVLSCDIKCENAGYDMIKPGSDHIDIDEAHSAVMNTKAIKEEL